MILVTGVAGFIGWKTTESLLEGGHQVLGVDNMNNAYDVRLKQWRLAQLEGKPGFEFHQVDICDRAGLRELFNSKFDAVINLAARAGVRASVENPWVYEVINLGNDHPVELNRVIRYIEGCLGKATRIQHQPRHPADVPATSADIRKAGALLGWRPTVAIEEGIERTVTWYRENQTWLRNLRC